MLLEAMIYAITPCPKIARRLGYLKENVSIISRYGRCKNAWSNHLKKSRDVIKEAIVPGAYLNVPIPKNVTNKKFIFLIIFNY